MCLAFFRKAIKQGEKAERSWRKQLKAYLAEYPQLDTELERRLMGELPENWDADLPCSQPIRKEWRHERLQGR